MARLLNLGSGACRGAEGWGPISSARPFDITPCFEEGIILPVVLVALLAFALTGVNSLQALSRRKRESRSNIFLLWAKEVCLGLAVSCAIANAVISYTLPGHATIRETYVLEVIALTSLPILTYFNHTRSRRASTVVLLFWPFYLVILAVWTRTTVEVGLPSLPILLILRWIIVALGFSMWTMERLGPEFGEVSQHDSNALHTENPLLTADIFNVWYFAWLSPIMKKGAKQTITEGDLPELLERDESTLLGDKLTAAMKKHKSLAVALCSAYGGPYAFAALLKILQDCLNYAQPQLLRLFLGYIAAYQAYHGEDGTKSPATAEGFSIVILMLVAALVQSIILHQYFQRCYETGMRVRAGLVSVIYKKALVLSSEGRGQSTGDIVNLMSVDATRLQDFCTYALIVISGPFQVTVAFISLYNLLGWSAFVGVAIMILSVPLNTYVARVIKKLQEQQMRNRDERTKLMSELLANVRSIKLYAWEHAFLRKVLHVRNEKELKLMRKISVATAMSTTLWLAIPILVGFCSFATASAVYPVPLTSEVIFPALSLFMLVQFPISMFAMVTSNLIEAWVSVKRLMKFFASDELQPDARAVTVKAKIRDGDPVLEIKGGEFSWLKEDKIPTLADLNVTVRKGELLGVYGRVGSGKSSLLSAVVGDMRRLDGEVRVFGTVAYACQNPWVMSATVRDNILFYHEYDEDFYNLVLDACALRPDLALMPHGDLTEVGEKGITMSGGQRARIALARAVYARADLTLLDDVLAAVDSQVARHIFTQVIGPRGLLSTKARILVTNSVAFAQHLDHILYLRRGIVIEEGPYAKLASNPEGELYGLINGAGSTSSAATAANTPTARSATPSEDYTVADDKIDGSVLAEKLKRQASFHRATLASLRIPTQGSTSQGLSTETSQTGRVNPRVYWRYIQAASKSGFALFMTGIILQQVFAVLGSVMLKAWGEGNRDYGNNRDARGYLWIYGGLSLSSALLNGLSAIAIWVLCALRSSKNLHDSMLHAVLRAPLTFFEVTPSGRIMNLFSRDTYVVDSVLARVIQGTFRTVANCLGIVVVIGASFPLFLFAVVPLGWFYGRVTSYYLATSRELQRLNAVSRSPLFSWFGESLQGLSTIRAFGMQHVFTSVNERRIDRNTIVGAIIIFLASAFSMVTLITSTVDAGLVGLVISYALSTTSSLNWLVRSASEVEQNIVSVERMLQYIELEPEAPYEIPETKPEGEWPVAGKIEFRNYSLRYRPELDLALKEVSLELKPAEKIGICGRTGAGKSTLLLALFRVLEPASGTIFIDGLDITKIGLHDLRSAISIVPQSPDLFEGTIRDNIDPVGEYQDMEIWEALEQAHLKEFVEGLDGKLEARVQEGGSSMSSGQRQLVCFARALLRKTKILVLDEATSAVDLQTDRAIQDIIRGPQFADVTLLTIAHRLNTIIDSDRILVLSEGKVVEFGSPQALLSEPDSTFRSLAAEAGLV